MIDIPFLVDKIPQLLRGALVSLEIAFIAWAIGLIGGIFLGIVQTSINPIFRAVVVFYTTIIRGTPMLIQIMFMYYIFSVYIPLSAFMVAVIAIGINSSAYISQIIRAGILSVNRGQIEAARTLGIKRADILRFIVLPQAFCTVLPALGNEAITLIKDSSLASLIGVVELYKQGQIIMSKTFDALNVYIMLALIYLIMTSLLSGIIHYIEKRLSRHVKNFPTF